MVTKMEGGHVWQNKHQVNDLATECRQFVLSCSGLVPFTSSLQGLLPEIPTQALSLSPLRIVDSPCLSRSSCVLSSIILSTDTYHSGKSAPTKLRMRIEN